MEEKTGAARAGAAQAGAGQTGGVLDQCCLVYTGTAGDVYRVSATGTNQQRLTWGWEEGASEQSFAPSRLIYVWPMWSPSGQQVACFSLKGAAGPAVRMGLYVMTADGVESWQLCSLSGTLPIYGSWSPDGEQIAALLQRERGLSLELFRLEQPGESSLLFNGSPLFWTWSPLGRYGAAHVGGSYRFSSSAWTFLFDNVSGKVVEELSARPGEFRAPNWSPDGSYLAYVAQGSDGQDALHLLDMTSGEKKPVYSTQGLTAFLWSPDSRYLAFGCAARQGSLLLAGLNLLDVHTQTVRSLLAEEITAFYWSPAGVRLFYVDFAETKGCLRWHALDLASGAKTPMATFLPSREQAFVLSFFDQYACSHPLISPDGAFLTFAGQLMGKDESEVANSPQVYVLPLDGSFPPRVVGEGHFACWSPSAPALG
jgi:Tol biopolymer transport system component